MGSEKREIIGDDGAIMFAEQIGYVGDDVLWQTITPDGRCVVARCDYDEPPRRWDDVTWWDVASEIAIDWLARRRWQAG